MRHRRWVRRIETSKHTTENRWLLNNYVKQMWDEKIRNTYTSMAP